MERMFKQRPQNLFFFLSGNLLDIRKGKLEDKGGVGQVFIYKLIIVLSLLSVNVHALPY